MQLEGLVKQYKTGDQALKGIDLEVPKGQVMALIGPSGAGKSTLIRCINRLVEPTSGRVLLEEEDTIVIYQSQKFPTTGFGYVYNLKPELAEKVKESFASFEWDKPDGSPTSLKEEFSKSNEGKFLPITYQEHWDVIRKIDAANNVSYACK